MHGDRVLSRGAAIAHSDRDASSGNIGRLHETRALQCPKVNGNLAFRFSHDVLSALVEERGRLSFHLFALGFDIGEHAPQRPLVDVNALADCHLDYRPVAVFFFGVVVVHDVALVALPFEESAV